MIVYQLPGQRKIDERNSLCGLAARKFGQLAFCKCEAQYFSIINQCNEFVLGTSSVGCYKSMMLNNYLVINILIKIRYWMTNHRHAVILMHVERWMNGECWMVNFKCWMMDSKCWMMNIKWWMLNEEYQMKNVEWLITDHWVRKRKNRRPLGRLARL